MSSHTYNIFRLTIFMLHQVTFCCSPIDKHRFELEHRSRLMRAGKFYYKSDDSSTGNGARPSVPAPIGAWKKEARASCPVPRKTSCSSPTTTTTQDTSLEDSPPPPDWSVLLRPLELAGLIKRYHMAGNTFLVFFVLHLLVGLHLTVKCIVHLVFVGKDQQMLDYFDTIYYPHFAGFLARPYRFNQLLLALCTICFSSRFRCAYQLIRGSIVNAHHYKELYPSQVNISAASAVDFTLAEIVRFIRIPPFFRKDFTDPAYLKLDDSVQVQLATLDRIDLLYYVNMMDFQETYKSIRPELGSSEPKSSYVNWHRTKPNHRSDISPVKIGLFMSFFGNAGAFVIYFACVFWALYNELTSSLRVDHQVASVDQVFARWQEHLADPVHLIRLVEFLLLLLLLVFNQYDSVNVYIDGTILSSRLQKLTHLIALNLSKPQVGGAGGGGGDDDFDPSSLDGPDSRFTPDSRYASFPVRRPHHLSVSHGRSSTSILNYQDGRRNCSWRHHYADQHSTRNTNNNNNSDNNRSDNKNYATIRELNERIDRQVRLADLLRSEFDHMRRAHSVYVNLVIIGSGISLSYTVNSILSIENYAELSVLFLSVLSSCFPTIMVLVLCANLERSLLNLYRAMSKVLINRHRVLDYSTVQLIINESRRFERQKDRVFKVGGIYAITLSSVVPFLAYMATAILYLDRFNFEGSTSRTGLLSSRRV